MVNESTPPAYAQLARAIQRILQGAGIPLHGLGPPPPSGQQRAYVFSGRGLDPAERVCVAVAGVVPAETGPGGRYRAPATYRHLLAAAGYTVVAVRVRHCRPRQKFWLVYPAAGRRPGDRPAAGHPAAATPAPPAGPQRESAAHIAPSAKRAAWQPDGPARPEKR